MEIEAITKLSDNDVATRTQTREMKGDNYGVIHYVKTKLCGVHCRINITLNISRKGTRGTMKSAEKHIFFRTSFEKHIILSRFVKHSRDLTDLG